MFVCYFINNKITNEAIVVADLAYDTRISTDDLRQTARNVGIRLQVRRLQAAGGIRGALPQVSLKSLLQQALPTPYSNYGAAFYEPW